jgi:hypothetical protein
VSETEKEREKTSKTRGDYASTIQEERYLSEPIKTEYLKIGLLILFGSGGI